MHGNIYDMKMMQMNIRPIVVWIYYYVNLYMHT
jgi:hypothetical protein